MYVDVLETYEINGVYKTEQDLSTIDKALVLGKESINGVVSFISNNKIPISILTIMAVKTYINFKTPELKKQ